jgi:hypothetical protein
VQNATQSNIAPGVKKRGIDHYYDETSTPAYAHSWMLTEVLSADYVDVTGNGPSPDDLGTYTKFNYGVTSGNTLTPDLKDFKWRTPITGSNQASASYMEGLKTDKTDDKANIIYGEKDIWYLHSIESKTQIAMFITSDRKDGLGANIDGVRQTDKRLQKIDKIKLYSKQEYDYDPIAAVPIKTVHFEYDYSLCKGTPNSDDAQGGKLTLKKVYFTYKNSNSGIFSPYEFDYRTRSNSNQEFTYKFGEVDRWNTYKPISQLPTGQGLTKSEYPYSIQNKAVRDDYSSAWHLKSISLPSGGKIGVNYESDDYAFVQNKAAMRMFKALGLSKTPTGTEYVDGRIFTSPVSVGSMRDYLIVQLDEAVANDAEFREKYLIGYGEGNHSSNPMKYLYYRFQINVNEGAASPEYEFVSGYAQIDGINNCGLVSPGSNKAYIKIKPVTTKISGVNSNVSPFAFSAWQFSRMNTPRKAYSQPEPTDPAITQFIQTLASANMFSQLVQFFQGPNGRMMAQGFGSKMNSNGSWVRLLEPDKTKLGGGNRVKDISISDEWSTVSPNEASARYGQEFSYTNDAGYSSGVAAYEPGVGADENPFRMPAFYNSPKQILIPEERYYLEEPFGESFFPGPSVGYSKVTIKDKVYDNNVTKNRTGKTIHEFYTSFDFPTITKQTELIPEARKSGVLAQLLKINARNYMTATQGYTIHLNDMHGKPKAQSMFAEGESNPFSYTKYHYKTLSNGQLDNMAEVIDKTGKVETRQIGVETDFIADMREQSTTGESISITANLATMLFGFVPIPIPSVFGSYATDKTRFRSAVTTKVVYSFGIQDRTETYDKGAYVQTNITAFDGQTGEPLVQELNNEFKDKYYKIDYPAHWAYTGMAQASQNIGYTFSGTHISSSTGVITDPYLEPGDEVLPSQATIYDRTSSAWQGNANTARLWVAKDDLDNKLYLIDYSGQKHIPSGSGNSYTVIRSGHRNTQSSSLGSVTSVASPLRQVGSDKKVVVDAASKVIEGSAIKYSEHWKTERGMKKMLCDSIPYTHPAGTTFTNIFNYILNNRNTLLVPTNNRVSIPSAMAHELRYTSSNCISSNDISYTGESSVCSNLDYSINNYPNFGDYFHLGDEHVYLSFTFFGGLRNCCDVIWLYAIDECSTFTATDWSQINHFTSHQYLSNSDFVFHAVMNDNSSRSFFLTAPNCIKIDADDAQKICAPYYECAYSARDIINPYLYGILGNWRAQSDYIFMGDRNNVNASTAENLRADGYVSNFLSYWKSPVSSTEVWKVNTAVNPGQFDNWSLKTRMTIYSPYGYDIENENPLPAFSSAQYGYLNTLPVAVADNAQQKEIGFDGFEDYYPWLPKAECDLGHFKFEDNESNISFVQSHTGICSMGIPNGTSLNKVFPITVPYTDPQTRKVPYLLNANDLLQGFAPNLGTAKKYVLNFWAKTETRSHTIFDYTGITPEIRINNVAVTASLKKSKIIADWQRYELTFEIPAAPTVNEMAIDISNTNGQKVYVDDIRIHPFDASVKTFVYNMYDMRYLAQLDENNFATFYEYDEEGKLVRVKKETERGIMTLQESRTNMYKR